MIERNKSLYILLQVTEYDLEEERSSGEIFVHISFIDKIVYTVYPCVPTPACAYKIVHSHNEVFHNRYTVTQILHATSRIIYIQS